MKINKFLMATAAVAVFAAGVLSYTAAYAIDSNLDVEAYVVEAITLDCDDVSLNFGNLSAAAAGVVRVSTGDARSQFAGGPNLIGGGTVSAGECTMDGESGLIVDFQIDDTTIGNGTDTMAVANYTLAGVGAVTVDANNYDITLDGALNTYTIGGDLTIAGTESAGNYTGTTTVTALYQ